jgi:hypothetical protein
MDMTLPTTCNVPFAGFVVTDIWFSGRIRLSPATTQSRYERRI